MRDRDGGHPGMARAASQVPPSSTREGEHEDFLFHLYRGSELLQDNRVMEAKEELEQALTLQPRDAKGQDLLAVVYFRIGLYPRAIHIYEELKRQSPNDPSLLLNLALCYLKTGQAQLARKELEALLKIQPGHRRALGYLGLAHERLGDLDAALVAFEKGGHQAMAQRAADKLGGRPNAPAPPPASDDKLGEVREAAAEAFSELDAGELSFALAEPITGDYAGQQWSAVEPGRPGSAPPGGASPSVPKLASQTTPRRAPTLSVGLKAPPPPTNVEPAYTDELPRVVPTSGGVLPSVSTLAAAVALSFPSSPAVIRQGPSILVRTDAGRNEQDERSFAVRLDAVRSITTSLSASTLERQVRGAASGEAFGGLGRPLSRIRGTGEICFTARPGHALVPFRLSDETLFLREEILLGFELTLAYENGRVATDEGDSTPFVQLKGTGTAVIELLGPIASVELGPTRSIHARREAIVGWIGRVVPRAVPAAEAPSGQRGLIAFAGEGTVFMALR